MNFFNEIDTPAIIVYKDKLMKNILDMQSFCNQNNISLRPMIKTHKMPQIAKLQVDNGAIGITCAKISEAQVMVKEGIRDIFIAYEIINEEKIKALIDLSKRANLSVAVDSKYGVDMLSKHFSMEGISINVLIEINSGLNRCGLDDLEEIYILADHITKQPNLRLKGLFTHAGHAYGATDYRKVEEIGAYEGEFLVEIKNHLKEKGISVEILSSGSTPTAKISGKVKGISEIRPGNYVFYDAIQVALDIVDIDRCALSVIATVVSKPTSDRAIIDAGSKTLALDKGAHGVSNVNGFGLVKNIKGITIERLSEEHGILKLEGEGKNINIGDKIEIIPNHACTVINLFDYINIVEENVISEKYQVHARGMVR